MTKQEEQLKDHLENAANWERLPTYEPGLFVVKAPQTKSGKNKKLILEINPLNEKNKPSKIKGLIISSTKILKYYNNTFDKHYDNIITLIDIIKNINADKTLSYRIKKACKKQNITDLDKYL